MTKTETLALQNNTNDSLQLKLAGDFEGSSAHELFNTLIEHGAGNYQILIDTNKLNSSIYFI